MTLSNVSPKVLGGTVVLLTVGVLVLCVFARRPSAIAAQGEANTKANPNTTPTLTFEKLATTGGTNMVRARIPGGWLVRTHREWRDSTGMGITFVPDPDHRWDGNSLPESSTNAP